jgi:hypothetical protein
LTAWLTGDTHFDTALHNIADCWPLS